MESSGNDQASRYFHDLFTKFLSQGLSPNEAAAKALLEVNSGGSSDPGIARSSEGGAETTAPTSSSSSSSPAPSGIPGVMAPPTSKSEEDGEMMDRGASVGADADTPSAGSSTPSPLATEIGADTLMAEAGKIEETSSPADMEGEPLSPGVAPLTLEELRQLFGSMEADSDSAAAIRRIGQVFSDPEALENSFLISKSGPLDLDAVEEAYRLIDSREDVQNACMLAIKRLAAPPFLKQNVKSGVTKSNAKAKMRKFTLLFLCPQFSDPDNHACLLKLCEAFREFPKEAKKKFCKLVAVQFSTDRLRDLVNILQSYLTIGLMRDLPTMALMVPVLDLMKLLFRANNYFADRVARSCSDQILVHGSRKEHSASPRLQYTDFYNDGVNTMVNVTADYKLWMSGRSCFCKYPFILDASFKSRILKTESTVSMQRAFRATFLNALVTGHLESAPYFLLRVRRSDIVPDTMRRIAEASANPSELRKPLKVVFEGEEGVDEGGVQKEFFQVMCRRLLDVQYGMFVAQDDGRALWFNGDSYESVVEFSLVGTLLGLAIYNGVILDVKFPQIVYKKLMNHKPTLSDLLEAFPVHGNSLMNLIKMVRVEEDDGVVRFKENAKSLLENMCLTFQISRENAFGDTVNVDLKPGGENIAVTPENFDEFCRCYVDFFLVKSVTRQYSAFEQGFKLMCAGKAFSLFRWEEIELLVCGSPVLDFAAWESSCRYQDGFTKDSDVVKWFWNIVLVEFDEEQKKKLLAFCTGSDRAPIRGLQALGLVISRMGPDSNRLPVAHTCFNHLLIPEYPTKEKLRNKLTAAIVHAEGFGTL